MLMTHVRPSKLWGKKVYDTNGNFLGEVIAIASRRGVVRKVVVQRAGDGLRVRLHPSPDSLVDATTMMLAPAQPASRPELRLVR
jgi:sporulation protein YlmC with PRC-barrel domain